MLKIKSLEIVTLYIICNRENLNMLILKISCLMIILTAFKITFLKNTTFIYFLIFSEYLQLLSKYTF